MKTVTIIYLVTIMLLCIAGQATFASVIKSDAGKCLDVHASDQRKNGARVQVWDCNGELQQKWEVDVEKGEIRSGAGKCLDVHAPDQRKNGARVQVWDCNGQPQQKWDVISDE